MPAPPSSAQAAPAGACCRPSSSCRSSPWHARCRWFARACVPSSFPDGRIHARRGRVSLSVSFWPPSRAPTADDYGGPADGSGSCTPGLELGLDLRRPIGAISPHVRCGVGPVEHIVELLAVVDARIRSGEAAHELVLGVNADVVLRRADNSGSRFATYRASALHRRGSLVGGQGRAKVREMMLPQMKRFGASKAWVIDDTGFSLRQCPSWLATTQLFNGPAAQSSKARPK
jgi:hypothetical protein